jgi:hypothetical protein
MFIDEEYSSLRSQITIHVRKLTSFFSIELENDDLEVYGENGNKKGKVYVKGNLIYSNKELEEKLDELINNINYNILYKEKGFVIELFR